MATLAILSNQTLDPVTIDSSKTSTVIYAPQAEYVAFQVVASSSSSPVGTTITVQGSIDGTNFVGLASAVSVTGDGTFSTAVPSGGAAYIYYRLAYARSSGSYVATTTVLTKGYAF